MEAPERTAFGRLLAVTLRQCKHVATIGVLFGWFA